SEVSARLVQFLTETYRPRFLVFYRNSSERGDGATGHPGRLEQIRALTRIADSESIPPGNFPTELVEFLRATQEESADGGLLVDLQARADRRDGTPASRSLSLFASFGAE